ncbi:hypothetical protein BC343_01080 [Mucilaginibacter pedocola]|uniref:Uncharacterized protein n=2 Tax=Mucilaginibacter pedocola TaxID=1792845 RepID=A0A1S9PL74_9SPHI|nr:hypothetical protein BC343_01080 [Mucilaginibacter pedocola]
MTLADCEQLTPANDSFDDSGLYLMSQLPFFDNGASDDIHRAAAIMLSIRIDSEFVNVYLATYAEGKSKEDALDAISAVLQKAEKTITDLADEVSKNYIFLL